MLVLNTTDNSKKTYLITRWFEKKEKDYENCFYYLLVSFDDVSFIPLDVFEAISRCLTSAIAAVIIAGVRLIFLGGIVTVVQGQFGLSGVGQCPPVLATQTCDLVITNFILMIIFGFRFFQTFNWNTAWISSHSSASVYVPVDNKVRGSHGLTHALSLWFNSNKRWIEIYKLLSTLKFMIKRVLFHKWISRQCEAVTACECAVSRRLAAWCNCSVWESKQGTNRQHLYIFRWLGYSPWQKRSSNNGRQSDNIFMSL